MLVRWPRREEKLQGAGVGKRGKGVGGQHSGGGGGGCTRTISSAEVFLQCLPDELQSWERALPVHIQYHKYKFPLLCIVKKQIAQCFPISSWLNALGILICL